MLHFDDSRGGCTLQLDDIIDALAAAAEAVFMLIYIIAIAMRYWCMRCWRTYDVDVDGGTQLTAELLFSI